MNDLRYDQEAADAATHAARMNPAALRTVPMPDLRTPDAEARDLRTAGDKIAELQQQVSDLRLEVDELKRVQTVTIAGLEAYIRDHSEVEE